MTTKPAATKPAATKLAATTITRIADSGSQAGPATNVSGELLGLGGAGGGFATAFRTQEGRLKIIRWGPSVLGGPIGRVDDSGDQAGAVTEVAVANGSPFYTAVRTGEGGLKLIAWDTVGSIQRVADSGNQAGAASQIAVAVVTSPATAANLVTACRTAEGRLKLIAWRQPGPALPIERLGDSGDQAGTVSRIAMRVDNDRVVTAVRTGAGTLRLIGWQISGDGMSITRKGDSADQAGKVSEIALSGDSVTAVRTTSGRLKLISWAFSPDLTTIERKADSGDSAGKATLIDSRHMGAGQHVTAARTASGRLKLIAFHSSGPSIVRTGDSGDQAGAVSEVSLATANFSDELITSVRDSLGNLKLIQWKVS